MPPAGGTQKDSQTNSDSNRLLRKRTRSRDYREVESDADSSPPPPKRTRGGLPGTPASGRKSKASVPVPTSQRNSSGPSPPADGAAAQQPADYPSGTWLWVKYVDANPALRRVYNDHYAAQVTGVPTTARRIPVAWADGTAAEEVAAGRVMRPLGPQEEKVVFDGPLHPGRAASLTQVTELLKKGSVGAAPAPRNPDGSRLFQGIVFTAGTTDFDKGLAWLSSSTSSFDPEAIAGRLHGPLPKLPPSLLYTGDAGDNAQGVPNVPNCIGAVLKLYAQFDPLDPIAQKLHAFHAMLPILLGRRGERRKTAPEKTVRTRCKLLLEGNWEKLFSQAAKALAPKKPAANAPSQAAANRPPLNPNDPAQAFSIRAAKVRKAEAAARAGNMSKARSVLVGAGVSTSATALDEMREKHPAAPLSTLPAQNPDPCLSDEEEDKLLKVMSRVSLCKLAESAPAGGAPDQWGWQAREHLGPLLANQEVGQLLVDQILVPLSVGYVPPMYAHIYSGGRLIAMSKFPKEGSRPLAIGDCFCRLVDKALSSITFSSLRDWFENTYTNTTQFANGTQQGAEKYHAALLLAIGGNAAPRVAQGDLEEDPIVVITLDGVNAFNALKRQLLVDVLTNNLTQDYGSLSQANCPTLPSNVHLHFPALRTFYGEKGRLGFHNRDGTFSVVDSLNGVQQGDVNSGKFFNIATLPLVGEAMKSFPSCYAPCFADNINIVGPLSEAYKAAEAVRVNLAAGGIDLQPRDSSVYIPTYNTHAEPPKMLAELHRAYPHMQLPWARNGIRVLGFPFGSDEFIDESLKKIVSSIISELPTLAFLDDGLIHFMMLRLCVNARLPYFLRGVAPEKSAPHAKVVDEAIWAAFGTYNGFEAGFEQDVRFNDSHIQFRLGVTQGGFGVTANETRAAAAFYAATSHAFQFAAKARFPALGDTLRSDDFRSSTFYKDYIKTRDFLLERGAISADDPAALPPPPPSQDAAQGPKPLDGGKKMVILPTFDDLIIDPLADSPEFIAIIPRQRHLTRLVVSTTESLRPESLTTTGERRVLHLAKRSFASLDKTGESPLMNAHHFHKNHELSHSPLHFLTSTHSLITKFPKHQFQVYTAYALGTPTMPSVLQPRKENGDYFPCRCSGAMLPNDSGHHKMVCRNSGMKGAHDHIEDEFVSVTRPAHIQCTASKSIVPKHADSNHQGDILTTLSPANRPFVLDVSVVHPYTGSGVADKGKPLETAYKDKVTKHKQAYESQGYYFLPIIGSTYGQQHDDFIRLQYIVANAQAEYVVKYLQPHKDFKILTGYCFAGIKGRIGAAFARALAYRALSCTKDGLRRHYAAYGPAIQAANQRLDLPVAPLSYAGAMVA